MTPLDAALGDLTSDRREILIRLASNSHISENDPLWVVVAAMNAIGSSQASPSAIKEVADHAAALRRANLRNVAFLIGLATFLGFVTGIAVTLAFR